RRKEGSSMLDKRPQFGWLVASVRKIKIEARKLGQEFLQQRNQFPAGDIGAESVLHPDGDAATRQGSAHHQQHIVTGDMRIHSQIKVTALLAKFPSVRGDLYSRAPSNTAMIDEFSGVFRPAMPCQVSR